MIFIIDNNLITYNNMECRNNKIRLTEAELNTLIMESVNEILSEGKWGDMAKRAGKGLAKAGLYGALTAGGVAGCAYSLDKGLENQERYEQSLNQQARMMNLGNEQDVQKWLNDRGLEDNEFNRQQAYDYFEGMSDEYFKNNPIGESKKSKKALSEERIAKALRNALRKTLG